MEDETKITMSPIDLSKEIKGLNLKTLVQGIIMVATVAIAYSQTTSQISTLKVAVIEAKEASIENKQATKETQQNNDLQHRIMLNQLREQEVRIVRLETIVEELKLKK